MNEGDVCPPGKIFTCAHICDLHAGICVFSRECASAEHQGFVGQEEDGANGGRGCFACACVPLNTDRDVTREVMSESTSVKLAHRSFGTPFADRRYTMHNHRRPRHHFVGRFGSFNALSGLETDFARSCEEQVRAWEFDMT